MTQKYYIYQFHGTLPDKLMKTLLGFCQAEPNAIYPLSYTGTLEGFLEKWNRPVMIVPKDEKEFGMICVTQHSTFGSR